MRGLNISNFQPASYSYRPHLAIVSFLQVDVKIQLISVILALVPEMIRHHDFSHRKDDRNDLPPRKDDRNDFPHRKDDRNKDVIDDLTSTRCCAGISLRRVIYQIRCICILSICI